MDFRVLLTSIREVGASKIRPVAENPAWRSPWTWATYAVATGLGAVFADQVAMPLVVLTSVYTAGVQRFLSTFLIYVGSVTLGYMWGIGAARVSRVIDSAWVARSKFNQKENDNERADADADSGPGSSS